MNLFELKILDAIQAVFSCRAMDYAICFFNLFGEYGIFWIALALVLLCFRKTRRIGIAMGAALLLGFLIGNGALKHLIHRPRPYEMNTAVQLLVPKLKDSSFPSGHALACFECATVLFCYSKKWGTAAFALAALVAFGRLYLYLHFPSDVLAGALLGSLFGLLSAAAVNRIFNRTKIRLI